VTGGRAAPSWSITAAPGLLVQPDDADGLAAALMTLVSLPQLRSSAVGLHGGERSRIAA
jgi:hypothetical protein